MAIDSSNPAFTAGAGPGVPRRARALPQSRRAPAARPTRRGHCQHTRQRLLDAGRTVSGQQGLQALRVDDVVRLAGTSHGTFYLYFSSRQDLLAALTRDALRDMDAVVAAFPRVSRGEAGRAALLLWVRRFCDTYAEHNTALRLLSNADAANQNVRRSGLRLLWRLADAITRGMTTPADAADPPRYAELTALACAMMLERLNYLLGVGLPWQKHDLAERVTAIFAAAFAAEPPRSRNDASPAPLSHPGSSPAIAARSFAAPSGAPPRPG